MKIEKKLIISSVINAAFIVLVGIVGFQYMNLVLTKLRFVEIADDLNASFLEMRLSEKNYFLFHNKETLVEIQNKIEQTRKTLKIEGNDIVRAIGVSDLRGLEMRLTTYETAIILAQGRAPQDPALESSIRTAGRSLKEYSDSITQLERRRVNEIILGSKRFMLYSFWAILILSLLISHYISQKIVRSLRGIEAMTKSISGGNFNRIEGLQTKDELGAVVSAINSMSEELAHREEQIIQSKKLASLGILTAGVAHEITNPLNNISMIAQTYDEMYDKLEEQDRKSFMQRVEAETERIRKIVKNLLDFSKPKEAHPREADINTVIQKTLMLVQNMIDVSGIETSLQLHTDLPHVFVDEHQIEQVLVNLITNAVQAMSEGGWLVISSRSHNHGESVEIGVCDTGKGIPPEFVPHIFDPFFSTKGDGGTGLGLSVSYGIIKNHGGEIRVESKVGVGTTFTVELPKYSHQDRVNNGSESLSDRTQLNKELV